VTWLVHLTENFAAELTAPGFSVGHESFVRGHDSRRETITNRLQFINAFVNPETRLRNALDSVNKRLSLLIIFQDDTDARELALGCNFMRFDVAFFFEKLNHFKLNPGVRYIDAHKSGLTAVPNAC
jgi:hypothetical protein